MDTSWYGSVAAFVEKSITRISACKTDLYSLRFTTIMQRARAKPGMELLDTEIGKTLWNLVHRKTSWVDTLILKEALREELRTTMTDVLAVVNPLWSSISSTGCENIETGTADVCLCTWTDGLFVDQEWTSVPFLMILLLKKKWSLQLFPARSYICNINILTGL